ncbi:MAG: outer membrane protein assembly factor BamD [bacterium]
MKFSARFSYLTVLVALGVIMMGCGGGQSINEMTGHQLLDAGQAAYQKGKYLTSIDLFQACLYNFPGRSFVDTAQYYLALSYFGNKEYEVAQVEFNRLALNYPASVYFEQSLFMRAVCYFESAPDHFGLDQESARTAIVQLEDFIVDFPESPVVADAQKYLTTARTRLARKQFESGVVYSRMGAREAAKLYFQTVIDDYTDTEFAAQASFMLAEQEFALKHYDQASRKFSDFQIVFPEHELAPKARQKAAEAAFKDAQSEFRKENLESARAKSEQLQSDYPGTKWADKASDLINKIAELMPAAGSPQDAES